MNQEELVEIFRVQVTWAGARNWCRELLNKVTIRFVEK